MEVELRKILKFQDPAPTIGQQNVSVRRMPVHGRYDFFDTSGHFQGLLVLVPIPLGMAMLGFKAGDEFEWPVPAGTIRVRVKRLIESKPEPALLAQMWS